MPVLFPIYLALLAPWVAMACAPASLHGVPQLTALDPSAVRVRAEERLHAARRFLVLLQDFGFDKVARADPDVVVVDYSWDGGADRELTREDVSRLRQRAGVPRLVLAYLSIGEAENYRYYWKDAARGGKAAFIAKPNRNWPGNFRVRYWDPEWQRILFGGPRAYLSRILAAGFDGVYLDTVDAAEAFEDEGVADAAARMGDLVTRLVASARAERPGFLVIAQNPYKILGIPAVVDGLSGAVAEAVAFRSDRPVPEREWNPLRDVLRGFRATGRTVMMVEYVKSADARRRFGDLCAGEGFLCYIGTRSLGRVGQMVEPAGRGGGSSP